MQKRHPQARYNQGPVRGETPQEGLWLEDRAMGREIRSSFAAAPGMVPNNPSNFYSTKAKPSDLRYDAVADGLTTYSSPYGDGRQFVRQEEPILNRPSPAANLISAAEPAQGAADQLLTPGYGFGAASRLSQIDQAMQQGTTTLPVSAQPSALGMSTGVSLGSGPRRNVPKPA